MEVEKSEKGSNEHVYTDTANTKTLAELSDDDLLKEIARRKAHRSRLAGAMKRLDKGNTNDSSEQACADSTSA